MRWMASVTFLAIALAIATPWAFADDPKIATICDIQQYNGIAQGDRVSVTGVCTGETGRYGSTYTFIADVTNGSQPYCCGILIYVGASDLQALRGECVTAVGVVQEYYDATEIKIDDTETIRPTVTDCGSPLPNPIFVKTGEGEVEQWESCLLETHCVTITDAPDANGVFLFQDDKTPAGKMHGMFAKAWAPPAVGDFYCTMRGILDFGWSTFRLRPRAIADDLDTTPQGSCTLCEGGHTPTPNPTQGPTATPNPNVTPMVVDLTLNKEQPNCFIAQDWFSLTASIQNPNGIAMNVDAYCVLAVYGNYYFWDSWGQDLDSVPVAVPANGQSNQSILEFVWPAGAGAGSDLNFYFAVMQTGVLELFSNLGVKTFCFQ